MTSWNLVSLQCYCKGHVLFPEGDLSSHHFLPAVTLSVMLLVLKTLSITTMLLIRRDREGNLHTDIISAFLAVSQQQQT